MTHGKPHAQDRQRATQEVGLTDATTSALEFLSGIFGNGRIFGRTDFEGHELNAMLDLVEHTDPGELAKAGEALWSARDAISDAADELSRHIGNVDWKGEAGTNFRDWGSNLVANTHALAKYADVAGLQITAAGSGLASVRSSMPPRDTRFHKQKVEDIPTPKRVKGNAEYDEAVKVEGHRQEAINQMNRLASFYSVSSGTLAEQQPPRFEMMPNVGVPRPSSTKAPKRDDSVEGSGSLGTLGRHVANQGYHATGQVPNDGDKRLSVHETINDRHRPDVGTVIDSVAPPLPTTPPVDTGQPPTHTAPGGTTHTSPPPFANGMVKPITNGPVKPRGNNPPPQARGSVRESATGKGTTSTGRAANAMGRGPVNQARATGRAASTGRMPMGRGGVTGGTPRAAGQAKSSNAGATRKGGVVGGRPTNQTSGSTSRVPRGTVIGGQKENPGRTQGTPGKLGQRGVIGAPNPQNDRTQGPRRTPGAPEGVVGAPKSRTTGPKGERAGFTPGGSGLVRGRGDQQHRDAEGAEQPPTPQQRPPQAPPETE
ncbi:hypothetical protein GCM10018793_66090 [Streptomyces sulfonofaciens]|uniref:Uncharacterized protein n=1 Tax=Streptomyces sulfonofaciens TaxID=68272 RepID=A0A919LAD5_9ACTN|nr:hypothetical protein [Streptomyces sulfonofaciens]GHH88031.1 hypothetical protein GCM10018793_66090 [Streptomyces sulfonofaciens]